MSRGREDHADLIVGETTGQEEFCLDEVVDGLGRQTATIEAPDGMATGHRGGHPDDAVGYGKALR